MTVTQVFEEGRDTTLSKSDKQFFSDYISAAMRQLDQIIAQVAPTDFPILLAGESGVGKEAVASYIHQHSRHQNKPFTKIVCGSLSPEVFETLRKGSDGTNHAEGSSTIGTLFLDEVTDLGSNCQASLLHAIPEGETASVGSFLRARIISTTNKSPEELEHILERGALRRDLYYRLNGVSLRLPPLRERREDLPGLVDFLLHKYSSQLSRPLPSISSRTLQIMQDYSWPGNIRELENVVRSIVTFGDESGISDLGVVGVISRYGTENHDHLSLKDAARAASRQVEKEMILKVLSRTHWNRKRAAQHLQISYKALLNKLRQMGLDESGSF